jgi:hypothetical protein
MRGGRYWLERTIDVMAKAVTLMAVRKYGDVPDPEDRIADALAALPEVAERFKPLEGKDSLAYFVRYTLAAVAGWMRNGASQAKAWKEEAISFTDLVGEELEYAPGEWFTRDGADLIVVPFPDSELPEPRRLGIKYLWDHTNPEDSRVVLKSGQVVSPAEYLELVTQDARRTEVACRVLDCAPRDLDLELDVVLDRVTDTLRHAPGRWVVEPGFGDSVSQHPLRDVTVKHREIAHAVVTSELVEVDAVTDILTERVEKVVSMHNTEDEARKACARQGRGHYVKAMPHQFTETISGKDLRNQVEAASQGYVRWMVPDYPDVPRREVSMVERPRDAMQRDTHSWPKQVLDLWNQARELWVGVMSPFMVLATLTRGAYRESLTDDDLAIVEAMEMLAVAVEQVDDAEGTSCLPFISAVGSWPLWWEHEDTFLGGSGLPEVDDESVQSITRSVARTLAERVADVTHRGAAELQEAFEGFFGVDGDWDSPTADEAALANEVESWLNSIDFYPSQRAAVGALLKGASPQEARAVSRKVFLEENGRHFYQEVSPRL